MIEPPPSTIIRVPTMAENGETDPLCADHHNDNLSQIEVRVRARSEKEEHDGESGRSGCVRHRSGPRTRP